MLGGHRTYMGAACDDSGLYIFGGETGSIAVANDLYRLSTSNVWMRLDSGTGPSIRQVCPLWMQKSE